MVASYVAIHKLHAGFNLGFTYLKITITCSNYYKWKWYNKSQQNEYGDHCIYNMFIFITCDTAIIEINLQTRSDLNSIADVIKVLTNE